MIDISIYLYIYIYDHSNECGNGRYLIIVGFWSYRTGFKSQEAIVWSQVTTGLPVVGFWSHRKNRFSVSGNNCLVPGNNWSPWSLKRSDMTSALGLAMFLEKCNWCGDANGHTIWPMANNDGKANLNFNKF